ncbi:MAG: hypothetical protein JRI56_08150 [Deltaproteobacteria bacterium]|nr:hypothetical protein [Deltaproteobacteria bacterium]
MSATLATARDQVEMRLQDNANLIFSSDTIDEALRASLGELSNAYGAAVTLKDLDGALLTTFDDLDLHTLLVGAVAYCTRFRLVGKFEEASPIREHPEDLARWATEFMEEFHGLLTHVRLRRFHQAVGSPYSQWDWEEGKAFS